MKMLNEMTQRELLAVISDPLQNKEVREQATKIYDSREEMNAHRATRD